MIGARDPDLGLSIVGYYLSLKKMNEVMTAKRLPADYRDAIATFADHFDHLFKKNILYETHKVFYCYFSITWKRTDNENEAEDIDNIEEVQSGGRCLTWAGVQTLLHEVPLQDGHGGGAEAEADREGGEPRVHGEVHRRGQQRGALAGRRGSAGRGGGRGL